MKKAVLLFMALLPTVISNAKEQNEENDVLTVKASSDTIIGDYAYKSFEVVITSAGNYFGETWLSAAQYADKSYTSFQFSMDGTVIGNFSPQKEGWQNVCITKNEGIFLTQGLHVFSVRTLIPEIPIVEFVKFAKSKTMCKISSAAYDSYIQKAEKGVNYNNTCEHGIDTPIETIMNSGLVVFTNVPLKNSFYTLLYFTAGQQVFMTATSTTDHIIDFFHSSYSEFQEQTMNWAGVSGPTANPSDYKVSSIALTIPVTGYYTIKARSQVSGVLGTVDVNVNGSYYYNNRPLYYEGRNVVQPADSNVYATMTISPSDVGVDPILYIEGAGSTPGRIVAYNDDAPSEAVQQYQLDSHDSFLSHTYYMPTSGLHVVNFSSFNPEGTCTVLARVAVSPDDEMTSAFDIANCSNVRERKSVTKLNTLKSKKDIYIKHSKVYVEIESPNEIQRIKVYNYAGHLCGTVNVHSEGIILPLEDLNMSDSGLYIICVETNDGVFSKTIVVE
jgi:hypothetical protein